MDFTEKINSDLKQAMLSKNESAVRTLRGIKAALLLAKTEKGGNEEITEEQAMKILQKLAKQRRESLDIYVKQDRKDLAEAEEQELKIIEQYLPKQMSEAEIREIVGRIIKESGATNASEIGKVMPLAMKELAGKADGKVISGIVREMLS